MTTISGTAPRLSIFSAASDALPSEPYVGLRPFRESERELFFGRANDAARLCNKILAGPLTVLYAPSGVGKTSLLVTFVVPDLRLKECLVLYFDRWTEPDPCHAIKVALLAQAGVEVPADLARRSLDAIVASVSAATLKPVVLILDQFESYLIRHAAQLDPLREELAALIRTRGDGHVVFSLRQEFLAGLDVFRDHILTLFRSTYHLHPLDEEGGKAAIEQPVERFGAKVEPELTRRLLADLRTDPSTSGDPSAMHSGGVELPFLQIVCLRLWRYMKELVEEQALPEKQMTLVAYESLGGAREIIKDYVSWVVASLPASQRGDLAKVLDCLAPRSGTKMAYAVADLCDRTAVPADEVRAILRPLLDNGVVRERQAGPGRVYELYHDAYIPIVRPEIDEQLSRIKFRKRLIQWGTPTAAVLALLLAGGMFWLRSMERERTVGMIDKLKLDVGDAYDKWEANRSRVTAGYDQAAFYLVGKSERRYLREITRILRNDRQYVTAFYGPKQSAIESQPQSGQSRVDRIPSADSARGSTTQRSRGIATSELARIASDSLAIGRLAVFYQIPANVGSDTGAALRVEWRNLASQLSDTLGIPIPTELALVPDRAGPRDSLRLVRPGSRASVLTVHVPSPDSMVVSEIGMREVLRRFYFGDNPETEVGLSPLDSRLPGSPLWRVPRWTAPIWKTSAQGELSRERIIALAIAQKLLREPALFLTDEEVDSKLEAHRYYFPGIVDRASAAPGGLPRLRAVLREVIRAGGSLRSLTYLLETIPDHPDETPPVLAARLRRNPWFHPVGATVAISSPRWSPQTIQPSSNVRPWRSDAAVRVYVSTPLYRHIRDEITGAQRHEVVDSLSELRHELISEWGTSIPTNAVVFHLDTILDRDTLDPLAFRFEILSQSARDAKIGRHRDSTLLPRRADTESFMAQIVAELRPRLVVTRPHWIGIDQVIDEVASLRPNQRSWLRSHYGYGDMRRILQLMITPTDEEVRAYAASGRNSASPATQGDGGVASAQWLLSSLVFWREVHGSRALDSIADRLRVMQGVRARNQMNGNAGSVVDSSIARGIALLNGDQVTRSQTTFREALRVDRGGAISAFLQLFPATARGTRLARAKAACRLPIRGEVRTPNAIDPVTRVELDQILSENGREALAPGTRRELLTCLLGGYIAARQHARAGKLFDRAMKDTVYRPRSADEGYRLGMWALHSGEISGKPDRMQYARSLVLEAGKSWTDREVEELLRPLASLCTVRRWEPWCAQMLDTLTAVRHGSFMLPYYFALIRAGSETRTDANAALALSALAEARLTAQHANLDSATARRDRDFYRGWGDWGRAKAEFTLAQHGERQRLRTAETLLRGLGDRALIEGYRGPSRDTVEKLLIDVYTLAGRYKDAVATLEKEAGYLGAPTVRSTRHFLLLANQAVDSALGMAEAALQEAPSDPELLFLSSTTRLLAGESDGEEIAQRFLGETSHSYRDYVRLLLYWSMLDRGGDRRKLEADAMLKRRWSQIDTTTWEKRLSEGDGSVWREMLIGYFVNPENRNAIFAPLTDQAHYDNSQLAKLGTSLPAVRCEAFFYDALLRGVTGPRETRRRNRDFSLDQAIATDYPLYYEYHMAKFLRAAP